MSARLLVCRYIMQIAVLCTLIWSVA